MKDVSNNNNEMQEAILEIKKKIWTKKNILRGITIILSLIILGSVWFCGYNFSKKRADKKIDELQNRIEELENTPVVLDPVTPEIVQKTITKKISEISELATAEYQFTNAAKFTDTKHIAILPDWLTEKSFVQKWDGIIKAGVDLENFKVDVKKNVITITLPYAEILSYDIDENSVEVLDEKNNIFNRISVKDKVNFDRETEYSMKARAVDNGLLEKAQKNAENTIINLISYSLDEKQDYKIKFVYIDK